MSKNKKITNSESHFVFSFGNWILSYESKSKKLEGIPTWESNYFKQLFDNFIK